VSVAIKSARMGSQGNGPSGVMGDPGLWGFLKRGAGALVTTVGRAAGVLPPAAAAAAATRAATPSVMGPPPGTQNGSQITRPRPGVAAWGQRLVPGGATGMEQATCPSGFHANKTSYFLKSGEHVPAGTRCVRDRRRNPMNARALSRAISRVDAGKRFQHKMAGISTRKYTSAGKRKDRSCR